MVKVTMETSGGVVTLDFQCSREEDHEILDAIRVGMMGDHEKRGIYVDSNHLKIQIKKETT